MPELNRQLTGGMTEGQKHEKSLDCSSRDPNRRSFAGAGTRAHTSLRVRQFCRRADD